MVAMVAFFKLEAVLTFFAFCYLTQGQLCDDTSISRVIYNEITTNSPIFQPEITIGGDGAVTSKNMRLTTSAAGSHGGFFLKTPTEFQGPGGFSTKFTLQATARAGPGEVWEFIIAREAARTFAPPPYGPDSESHGKSGWSRRGALVVEFDDRMSGSEEGDSGSTGPHHVSVFLDGTEQCSEPIRGGYGFGDGAEHSIWIDYIGFKGVLEVFVAGPGSRQRPAEPAIVCPVDMWGKLNIQENNHVGFAAYNTADQIGVEHSLVDGISIADAYRPFDKPDCAVFANCKEKDIDTLCVVGTDTAGVCELRNCDRTHVWDVTGSLCCAFVEKASWVVTEKIPGFDSLGDRAPCVLKRKTISFITDNLNCTRSLR